MRFDDGSRALYATDGSNYRQAPIGVVLPRSKEDVVQTMALARQFGAPVLSRGGGTSLRGQCCNVAVVMDFTKYMHGVLKIDAATPPGHGSTRLCAGRSARRRQEAGVDVRPRPGHAQPQRARRHARQRFVRHPLVVGRQARYGLSHRRQHPRTGNPHLRRRTNARRRNLRRRVGEHHPPGRPPRRDLRQTQGAAREVRRRDSPSLSEPAASRLRLQPRIPAARTQVPRRPRPGRLGRHPRLDSGGDDVFGAGAEGAHDAGARLPRRVHRRRPRHRHPAAPTDRPGGHGSSALRVRDHQGIEEEEPRPDAGGHRLFARRVRRRQQGGRRRPGHPLHGVAQEAGPSADHEDVR